MTFSSISHPEHIVDDGARADVARSANYLIARLGEHMLAEGSSASEISLMRHDIVQCVCCYVPDAFLARRRSA